ncbi:hypothetical protein GTU35_000128 [Vibrio fluvialis]|nr:hypothetical protein [Vibrio fluvialis]
MVSKTNELGWIAVEIPFEAELAAKKHRKERDKLYGNIYYEEKSDERWGGDLGEFAFKSWLNSEGYSNYTWLLEDAAGRADFTMVDDVSIDVKTVKRKVEPRRGYTAQITAQHINEPTMHYFFMSYHYPQRVMWLLGGISKEDFKRDAIYYGQGDKVHEHYSIRAGHEIYNIDILKLLPPKKWLLQFQQNLD